MAQVIDRLESAETVRDRIRFDATRLKLERDGVALPREINAGAVGLP